MNEAYTKLMLQQSLSKEADAAFYEKLENTNACEKRKLTWKVAAIAACVLLLIPVTVLAVENIFGVTKVTQYERPTYDDRPGIGLDIVYENIENYALENFPEHLQELEDFTTLYYDSWEDAEEDLGIDLVSNSIFNSADTRHMTPYSDSWNSPKNHCAGVYRVMDGQLYSASIHAAYKRDGIGFSVNAMITADHPAVNQEDIQKYYHGSSITYVGHIKPTIHTEQYITQTGIPVLIVTVIGRSNNEWPNLYDCNAYFAVNNISYEVCITDQTFDNFDLDTYANLNEKAMATMIDVLEGFTLE